MIKTLIRQTKKLRAVIGPYKKTTIMILLLMIIGAVFEALSIGMIIPMITTIIKVDPIYSSESKFSEIIISVLDYFRNGNSRIVICTLIFLTIIVVKNVLMYLKTVMAYYLQSSIRKHWSVKILERYIYSEYNFIISQKRGTLINNLLNETMLASKFIGKLIGFVSKMFIVTAIYIVMTLVSYKLTLLLTIVIGLMMMVYMIVSEKRSKRMGKKRLSLMQTITADGEQSLNAIRQVKLFALEKRVLNEFSKHFNHLRKLIVNIQAIRAIPGPIGEITIIAIFTGFVIYIDKFTEITISNLIPLITFVLYSAQKLYMNISSLFAERVWLISYLPSINLVSNILMGDEIKHENLNIGKSISRLNGDIIFNNVSFSYHKNKKILDGINLTIQKNKITGITGKSGSGKSTIVDLLCGLAKNYDGEIIFGDINLNDINIKSLRSIIGLVSQDTFLFNKTVFENISIGNKLLKYNDVIQTSKDVRVHKFISNFENGYNSIVGDRGLKISGGQKQMVTLIRAFAKKPNLLILDEGTSSLDKFNEKNILDYLKDLKNSGTTIVIITHINEILKTADKVYRIDNGKIG